MRPAHLIDSSVSRTSRQGFFARKIQLNEIGLKISHSLFCMRWLQDHVPFAKSSGKRQKTLSDVKKIFPTLALTAMLSLASCGWFGSPEAYKSESGRTTFRAAKERPSEPGQVTPASQKIPGESR